MTDKIINNANIDLQDSTELLAIIHNSINAVNYIYDFDDIERLKYSTLSDFKENVVDYISGFVVKKLNSKLSCQIFIDYPTRGNQFDLIRRRDYEL